MTALNPEQITVGDDAGQAAVIIDHHQTVDVIAGHLEDGFKRDSRAA